MSVFLGPNMQKISGGSSASLGMSSTDWNRQNASVSGLGNSNDASGVPALIAMGMERELKTSQ